MIIREGTKDESGRGEWGVTCEHGVVGYCESCALRDPGEIGETKPKLVRSDTTATKP